jgi:hypothetical protein
MVGTSYLDSPGPSRKYYSLVVLLSICEGGELRVEIQSDRNKIANAGTPIPMNPLFA